MTERTRKDPPHFAECGTGYFATPNDAGLVPYCTPNNQKLLIA